MSDLAVQLVLSAQDDASAAIAKVRDAMGEVGEAAKGAGEKAHETESAFERIKAGFETGLGIGLGIAGFHELRDVLDTTVETMIGFNAELETMGMRLENLTGSVGATTEALQAVREQADASPFEFKDIEAGEERLLRFNFSIEDSTKLLKVASDAAAGGAGSVDLITEAFGRMNTKEELTSRGLMSLTAAGIPVFDMLAEGLGVSTAQAEDLVKKGLIPAREGIDILSAAIEAKFPDMAAKVATGFDSTVKNLKETIAFAAAEMGKPLFDVLESAIQDALAFLNSPDVQGALDDFAANVASTVRDVVGWFKELGGAMSQPEVQANLHAAWENIRDIGSELWGLVRDFFIPQQHVLNDALGVDGVSSANSFSGQVKTLSGELRGLTESIKDVTHFFGDLDDKLNGVKGASDWLSLGLHNGLVMVLQDALSPLQDFIHGLEWLESLANKTFHINIDIPGLAGLQAGLASIHTIDHLQTDLPAASSAGGPGGIPNASAANTGLPAAGDVRGWAAWLQASGAIPADLIDDPVFLSAVLTGGKAESGLAGNKTQPTYIDSAGRKAGGAAGLFQFDPGGMGAGLSPDFLNSPEGTLYEAQKILPQYAAAYRSRPAGLSGAALAAYVADQAEAPAGAWPGGAGDNNYRANYVSPDWLTGGASNGGAYGPMPVAGGAGFIGPAAVAATPPSTAEMAAKLAEPMTDTFAKLMRDSATKLTGIQTTEDRSLASAASQYGAGGTADQAADRDAAKKSAALDSNKAIADDAARRKAAVAAEVADDTERENQRLASEAVVYNRGLQDEATAHARKLEDDQVLVDQQVAHVELVHQRDLQDAQTVHQQTLALAATKHQQDLQDAQTLLNEQLAHAQLLHQRQLQDAQVPLDQQLQAQATVHSRTLEDTEVQYQFQRSMGKATTDAQRAQIKTAHEDELENIAHQRQLQDAEAVYQQGLQATARKVQRDAQDAEIKYQDDQKAQQVAAQRVVAATESQYQMGLAAQEVAYQRGLQDTEITYQQGVAAQARARSRALADEETAYNRTLEDKAAAHTAELAATARAFAASEKAKVDAVDKQLADEAFARQKQQVIDDLAAKKASIAEEYAAKVAAAIETAKIARETLKTATEQSAEDQIAAATKALAGFNGAGQPIIDKMKADWAAFDDSLATATGDVVGNQTAIQAAQTATADNATAATAVITTATTDASADYAQSAQDISESLGITDLAVEEFADRHHTDWERARVDLNAAAQHAQDVLGEGGTIPSAVDDTTTAFDAVATAAANTSPLEQLKTAAQELADQGLDPATKAAQDLQAAIQAIQDRTVTVNVAYNNSGGPGGGSGGGGGGGGSSGGGGSGGDSGSDHASPFPGHVGESGPGGIYNDPSTGHPYTHARGGVTTGPVGGVFGEAGPEAIIPLGDYFVSRKSDASTSRLSREDARLIAEELVHAMNKNGSFAVGVDQIHSALLQKARRSPLGLT